MRIVFDIDGTISDAEHRLHHIKGETKDWEAFYAALVDDEPITPMMQLLTTLLEDKRHSVYLVTGRSYRWKVPTLDWLRQHIGPTLLGRTTLYMRASNDFREDFIVKEEILMTHLGGPLGVDLAIDDRQQVVDMWRRHGIRTLQCAVGDF